MMKSRARKLVYDSTKSSNWKKNLTLTKNTDIVSVRIDKADREKQNNTE